MPTVFTHHDVTGSAASRRPERMRRCSFTSPGNSSTRARRAFVGRSTCSRSGSRRPARSSRASTASRTVVGVLAGEAVAFRDSVG